MKNHWEKVYGRKPHDQLGWHEDYPSASMDLIRESGLGHNRHIFIAGAGATRLADVLLEEGYTNLTANDLSSNALDQIRQRIGIERSRQINWAEDDLTKPSRLHSLHKIDLWHDRAVLHFFTESRDQETYMELLHSLLRPGGYAIIATFNLSGAEKCSGLPVKRYNAEMLQKKLGTDYELIRSFDYQHVMPNGEIREYIYTFFRRFSTRP